MNKSSIQYLFHPTRFLVRLDQKGLLRLKDEKYLQWLFAWRLGYKLDLDNPRTFNEKIQWLKLNEKKSYFSEYVDKYEVKNRISEILGKEFVIETIGVYDSFDQIDFNELPDRFVIKTTHDSGGVVIVKDKKMMDMNRVREKIQNSLVRNYFYSGREWPYKNVKPRIICETLEADCSGELHDYKVFVFCGKAVYVQVDYDRFTDHHRNFYDCDWNYVPFTTMYPTNPDHHIKNPECLDMLLESAEKVAGVLEKPPYLRVDFYIIDSKLKFGEVTFYHGSGMEKFEPIDYDYKLGDMIKL